MPSVIRYYSITLNRAVLRRARFRVTRCGKLNKKEHNTQETPYASTFSNGA